MEEERKEKEEKNKKEEEKNKKEEKKEKDEAYPERIKFILGTAGFLLSCLAPHFNFGTIRP
jgi:hypothetical protein